MDTRTGQLQSGYQSTYILPDTIREDKMVPHDDDYKYQDTWYCRSLAFAMGLVSISCRVREWSWQQYAEFGDIPLVKELTRRSVQLEVSLVPLNRW